MNDGEPNDEFYRWNGYDGNGAPLHIKDINCDEEPAVILGDLRDGGLIIRAEGIGFLVVEKAPPD